MPAVSHSIFHFPGAKLALQGLTMADPEVAQEDAGFQRTGGRTVSALPELHAAQVSRMKRAGEQLRVTYIGRRWSLALCQREGPLAHVSWRAISEGGSQGKGCMGGRSDLETK